MSCWFWIVSLSRFFDIQPGRIIRPPDIGSLAIICKPRWHAKLFSCVTLNRNQCNKYDRNFFSLLMPKLVSFIAELNLILILKPIYLTDRILFILPEKNRFSF